MTSYMFQDRELRRLIRQDVVRMFPDLEFFQAVAVQDILADVLFIHTHAHLALGNRQG